VAQGQLGKVRSVVGVIVLSIITLGIYSWVWEFKTFNEMKNRTGTGIGGGLALVFAILLGGIPNLFLMPAEVGNMYVGDNKPKPISGVAGFWVLIPIVGGIIWVAKVQGNLNRYWQSFGAPGEAVATAPYVPAPPA
jgi:Domain of unknown function (DUF4234)